MLLPVLKKNGIPSLTIPPRGKKEKRSHFVGAAMAYLSFSSGKATLIGLSAPIAWGMSVGLVRAITEQFGLAAGLALLYLSTCAFLLLLLGLPKIRLFPKKYLFAGIPLANVCSVCFCLSLYLSDGGQQTVEVGMVNYLWPCLVVLFAVLFNGQKARWWIIPGTIISFFGITLVLGGENGLQPLQIWEHINHNPWSYILAFCGAVAWAAYSNLTRAWSNGQNPTLIIFFFDSIIFSGVWAMGYGDFSHASTLGWVSIVTGAIAMGGAYAAWSYGVTKGNITILAIASYFTPVLSCIFATVWIDASLSVKFWQGVAVLVLGSLLCWSSTVMRK